MERKTNLSPSLNTVHLYKYIPSYAENRNDVIGLKSQTAIKMCV